MNQILKLSKLSEVSAYTKSIERQKVSTYFQIFVLKLSALKVYPDVENINGTVKFTAKFIEFWKNVNVHTPISRYSFERFEQSSHSYPKRWTFSKTYWYE